MLLWWTEYAGPCSTIKPLLTAHIEELLESGEIIIDKRNLSIRQYSLQTPTYYEQRS